MPPAIGKARSILQAAIETKLLVGAVPYTFTTLRQTHGPRAHRCRHPFTLPGSGSLTASYSLPAEGTGFLTATNFTTNIIPPARWPAGREWRGPLPGQGVGLLTGNSICSGASRCTRISYVQR